MRTLILTALIAVYAISVNAQATDRSFEGYSYMNVLKLSPFELSFSEFHLTYERYFKDRKQSLVILPAVILRERDTETKEGFQVSLQYRFYLSHLQKESHYTMNMFNIGFYAAPYLTGLTLNQSYETYYYDRENPEESMIQVDESVRSIEGGALMGIQLDITPRIALDFFAGGGIRKSDTESNYPEGISYGLFEKGYTGVKPTVGFQFGFTF